MFFDSQINVTLWTRKKKYIKNDKTLLEVTNHSLFSLHEMERKKKKKKKHRNPENYGQKEKTNIRKDWDGAGRARIEVLSDIRLKENWDDIATG